MTSRPCFRICIAAGRTLTWQAEHELPWTSTTARPCFLSTSRWNSARSRGRDLRFEAADLLAGARELFVDRALLGAPVLEPLLVLLGLGRQGLLALVEVGARLLDLLLELEELVLGRADELLDPVDLVQGGGVLAAGLHVAQLRLVLLQLFLVVGELALGLALLELGLGQPRLERRDGLRPFPGTRGRPRRDRAARCPAASRGRARNGCGSGVGRAVPEDRSTWNSGNEKGCSGCGTPFR